MGLLNSLFGKDARKFINRKDYDAGGEADQASEKLRSSLFNDIQTSEGAKLQQQRFCRPSVAMTFNFVVSVAIILANKLVMGKVGFNFPILLTLIHYTCSWILLAIFKALSLLPVSPPSKTTPFSSLFSLSAVIAISTGLANISLKHNSVGFYQMTKIAVTPLVVLAEFILLQKKTSFNKVLSLTVISVGVAVATKYSGLCYLCHFDAGGEEVYVICATSFFTDLELNFFGACIALAWIIPSATNKILWSNLQQQANWTALALMWKTTPVTILFLLVLMPWLDPPGALSFDWNVNNTLAIIFSSVLGFLIQWSGALALGATSATASVVLGQFKTCVLLLGGYLIFNSDLGVPSICGAVAALCGMTAYTSLNLRKPKGTASKLPT